MSKRIKISTGHICTPPRGRAEGWENSLKDAIARPYGRNADALLRENGRVEAPDGEIMAVEYDVTIVEPGPELGTSRIIGRTSLMLETTDRKRLQAAFGPPEAVWGE